MSCPCEKHGSYPVLNSAITNSLNQRVVADPTRISKSKIAQADKLSLLQFAHCADKPAFVKAFGPYLTQTEYSESDLRKLADLWETGKDKEHGLHIERIFGSINLRPSVLRRCNSIKWTD